MITRASRYELRDRKGDYVGTFVSDNCNWQIGDVFTTGDRRVLRIIGIATVTQQSREQPAYTGGLMVESVESTP